jgi:thiamine-monophosphate kinase
VPEFELIERIRARVGARPDVILGIGDDGALLRAPAGQALVAAMDALVSGVHFPADTPPADIGWKALAVNLSDLAAMGAEPAWALLSLTLPEEDGDWLDAFLDGFMRLADAHRLALVGGDTTRGPLALCVQVLGFVPPGAALRRQGARPGDRLWVTGTLGDAAAGLARWGTVALDDPLVARLLRPTPRIEAGLALRGQAHAAIDVSDGLLADLGHLCTASGVGAELVAARLPASAALAGYPTDQRLAWQLGGGDDYELLFALPEGVDAGELLPPGLDATAIGRIIGEPGVHVLDGEGHQLAVARAGYQHFGAADG